LVSANDSPRKIEFLASFVATGTALILHDFTNTMDDRTFSDPVDCTVDFDTSVLQGKTAIVTGGVNGLGQAYVRALDSAG
jgi:hypothetical protein